MSENEEREKQFQRPEVEMPVWSFLNNTSCFWGQQEHVKADSAVSNSQVKKYTSFVKKKTQNFIVIF